MPPQARLGDLAKGDPHGHGCPACTHPVVGPLILGAPNVFVNGMPAGRKTDMGLAAACCGPNMWEADAGSGSVEINGLAAFRKDDKTKHCFGAGSGKLTQGSPNVETGG
jgi:uncharacterized Zn-binding protein involved in type VI secretion